MVDAWFLPLSNQLTDLPEKSDTGQLQEQSELAGDAALQLASSAMGGVKIWKAIRKSLNLGEARPRVNPDVIMRELSDRRGPYFILKNTRE